jgi:hypothetical protein
VTFFYNIFIGQNIVGEYGTFLSYPVNKAYKVSSICINMINSTKYNKISVYIRKDEKAVIEEKALMEGVSISRYLVLAALHNDLNFEKSK